MGGSKKGPKPTYAPGSPKVAPLVRPTATGIIRLGRRFVRSSLSSVGVGPLGVLGQGGAGPARSALHCVRHLRTREKKKKKKKKKTQKKKNGGLNQKPVAPSIAACALERCREGHMGRQRGGETGSEGRKSPAAIQQCGMFIARKPARKEGKVQGAEAKGIRKGEIGSGIGHHDARGGCLKGGP